MEGWQILKGNENAKNVLNALNIIPPHAELNRMKYDWNDYFEGRTPLNSYHIPHQLEFAQVI